MPGCLSTISVFRWQRDVLGINSLVFQPYQEHTESHRHGNLWEMPPADTGDTCRRGRVGT